MAGGQLRHLVVALVGLTILLAGCAGGAGSRPDASAAAPFGATLAHSSGDGVLEGRVVDDEARPLAGASIGGTHRDVSNVSFQVSTDAEGTFRVTGLLPGPYVLQASRLGFESSSARLVEVPDKDVVTVLFTLTPLPLLEPFHETKSYAIYWAEEFGILAPAPIGYFGIITGWEEQNVTMPIEVDEKEQGELAAVVVETQWRPPLSQCPGAFRSDVYSPEQTGLDPDFPPLNYRHWGDENPFHWDNVPERPHTPTHLFIPRVGADSAAMHSAQRTNLNGGTPIETSGKWIVEINSAAEYARGAFGTVVDIACTYDTTVRVHATVFHIETPDPTWSFLPPE